MSTYPVPSYAANIWLVGDMLHVGFPPLEGNKQGHTIKVPATEHGLKAVVNILQARQRDEAKSNIGRRSSPVQYDIKKIIQEMKKPPKKQAPEELTLEDLGL